MLSRKARRRLRRRLENARLGRWQGEGANKKFVPLRPDEMEKFVKSIDEKVPITTMEDVSTVNNEPKISWWNRHFGHVVEQWDWQKRPGLKHDWWGKNATIHFNAKAYAKMVYYCQSAHSEVSGFCKMQEIKNEQGIIERIEVLDTLLLKQSGGQASTSLDEECMSKLLYELARKDENPANWKLWWHTHYNFNVYWSGIDDGNITRLLTDENIKAVSKDADNYLISTNINQSCDIIGRIDQLNEQGQEMSADVKVAITPIKNNNWKSQCTKQVKRLVGTRTWKTQVYSGFANYSDTPLIGYQIPQKSLVLPHYLRGFNVMSNLERRRQGIPQDPELADFLPDLKNQSAVPNVGLMGLPWDFYVGD
jgi:hypothetical protein